MKLRVLLAIIGAALITSCATTMGYEKILNSWLGNNINNYISANGYPDSSFTAPNGNKVYVYNSSGSVTLPTQSYSTYNLNGNSVYGNTYTTGGQTINLSCKTYIEVNAKNIITTWQWKGNNCVA